MSGLELTAAGWAEIALAFGLAASAIVVLYLVRLRRRVVVVPFVPLFREALPDERTTRLYTRLKNILSLLLVLLVAALIALALGLPRLREERAEARTIVVLLDATASMQARSAGGPTRFEQARDAAVARIASLAPGERVLVVAVGARARVLHPLTDEHVLAARALREAEPSDAPGEAAEAMTWAEALCARDVEQGADRARTCAVGLYTDGGLRGLAGELERLRARGLEASVHVVEAEGEPENVAITALSARRFPADPSRAELLVEVTSWARQSRRVTLEIAADGALAHRETLELPAGGSVRRTLDELTGADALFEARLTGEASSEPLDALALDDVAWARLAPRRRRRALLVAPADRVDVYLEAALLLDPFLDVARTTPEAYEARGAPADREIVLFDGYTPRAAPSLPSVLLAPGEPTRDWLPVGDPIARPRFDTQLREHPLLAFVALRDVNVASARPLLPAAGDEVVAGEARGALLVTGTRGEARFVALGFDVRESDLPLRIAWPILVLDAISFLLPDDVTLAPSARTGRPSRLAVQAGDAALSRRGAAEGEGAVLLAARQGVAELGLERVGVYDVVGEGEEDAPAAPTGRLVVANLFDRAESSLAAEALPGAAPIDAGEVRDALARLADRREDVPRWPLHVLLVAAALALLAFEWVTFHRRWTT